MANGLGSTMSKVTYRWIVVLLMAAGVVVAAVGGCTYGRIPSETHHVVKGSANVVTSPNGSHIVSWATVDDSSGYRVFRRNAKGMSPGTFHLLVADTGCACDSTVTDDRIDPRGCYVYRIAPLTATGSVGLTSAPHKGVGPGCDDD